MIKNEQIPKISIKSSNPSNAQNFLKNVQKL
jgi:hypothetical protein